MGARRVLAQKRGVRGEEGEREETGLDPFP